MTEFLMTPLWGGNVAGIIVGGLGSAIFLLVICQTFYNDFVRTKELSDEEFTQIVLDELDEEKA